MYIIQWVWFSMYKSGVGLFALTRLSTDVLPPCHSYHIMPVSTLHYTGAALSRDRLLGLSTAQGVSGCDDM